MSPPPRTAAVLAGLLLLTSLGGCAGRTDRYCDELSAQRQTLSDLAAASGRPGKDLLDDTLAVWQDLRDKAPGDIQDEWTTLVFALQGLLDAFHDAGTTPDAYDPASPAPGMSSQEGKQLRDAAAELASGRVRAAGDAVQQHARDVCKVDLGVSS